MELGHITPETRAILDKELMPVKTFVMMGNAHWDSQIAVPKTEKEMAELGQPLPIPTVMPTTLRETIAGMPLAFDPTAASDLSAAIQFDVGGEVPGQYYLRIAEGQCIAFEGEHPSPTLTIHAPSEVWLAISRGELDGAQAMMEGKYTISGDLNLLIRFFELFPA